MFRAHDTTTSDYVNILDPGVDAESLRERSRNDALRCPVCNQPVVMRAGEIRRAYFAHKHLGDCPSSRESPELLTARATLYRWLITKFPGRVSVERSIDGFELPRYCDCYVEMGDKPALAYWIFDRRATPSERDALIFASTKHPSRWTFIFLASMMQRNDRPRNLLNLTPTERRFLRRSGYDLTRDGVEVGKSIHYIDPLAPSITTFRAMRLHEPPQAYEGVEVSTPMNRLLVSPSNGEFAHPGEPEQLQRAREAARKRQQEEEQRAQALRERNEAEGRRRVERLAARAARVAARSPGVDGCKIDRATTRRASPPRVLSAQLDTPSSEPIGLAIEVGVCETCGQQTTDWWWYKNGKCRCRPCQRATSKRHS